MSIGIDCKRRRISSVVTERQSIKVISVLIDDMNESLAIVCETRSLTGHAAQLSSELHECNGLGAVSIEGLRVRLVLCFTERWIV